MAIPIYVPEEYGPSPTPTSQPRCQATATSRASFVHQLIEELYAIYQDYCATSESAVNHVSVGEPNNNLSSADLNNSLLEVYPSARRSHIDHGKCPGTGHGHHVTQQKSYPDSEHNCKLARQQLSNSNNVGFQLRQVADSFENHAAVPNTSRHQQADSKLRHRIKATWRGSLALCGSLFFFTATAAILLTRRK